MSENNNELETLELEVKTFANNQVYWGKYLAQKILLGQVISDEDIENAYNFLLEELEIKEKTKRPDIIINCKVTSDGDYKDDLHLLKIENVEGVNALIEKQTIEFSPNLTIIYGMNGSGKSGYVRLLKKVFYSKLPEEILPNVYLPEDERKDIKGSFVFSSESHSGGLEYPRDSDSRKFRQFAVFDGKGINIQLEKKNEFEFKPAGLNFFSDYNNVIKKVEQKLNLSIQNKTGENLFLNLFDGESVIKEKIVGLSGLTKIEDLKMYVPFSEEDKANKEKIQKEYDNLFLNLKSKEQKEKEICNIKILLSNLKKSIEFINQYFKKTHFENLNNIINEYKEKEEVVKKEGIENFKSESIQGIGSQEWKSFILSAENFAKKQGSDKQYPKNGDICIFCHQPLNSDALQLISNYWAFIKSVAEENLKKIKTEIDDAVLTYKNLNFDLLPKDNILTIWISEKYPKYFETFLKEVTNLKEISEKLIKSIEQRNKIDFEEVMIDFSWLVNMEEDIDNLIKSFRDESKSKILDDLLAKKTFYEHKEKLSNVFSKIEQYINNQVWLMKAKKADFFKLQITNEEKKLSNKYFNQKYIGNFKDECEKLNGCFDIEVSCSGTEGKSYKQLKLLGRTPNSILSEGEQKVIAIADFMAEMSISSVNKGMIFDDPVNSLDDNRKTQIACRIVKESKEKQVIVFTHDLTFVNSLLNWCKDFDVLSNCHWIENLNNSPGKVWLNNCPSYDKKYKDASIARNYYSDSIKENRPPSQREDLLKNGFGALRTSYEALVIQDLFNSVVKRFDERVSVESLTGVIVNSEIVKEIQDGFSHCCEYMEGHLHSDKYSSRKPIPKDLLTEIEKYENLKKEIKKIKKDNQQ